MQQTIALLQRLSRDLENASEGRWSSNDVTPDRLLWEIFNKIFTILVTCENGLRAKDSLAIHLVVRYAYEMLVVFFYIFLDESKTEERARQFISFNQFKNTERQWTNKTFAQMVESISNNEWLILHKGLYRGLSNFAHPTMDSFMLNRRGDESEFMMNLSTVFITIGTILEIIRTCFDRNLYFNDKQKSMLNISELYLEVDKLTKDLNSASNK